MTDIQIDELTISEISKLIDRLRYAKKKKNKLNYKSKRVVNNIDDLEYVTEKVSEFIDVSIISVRNPRSVKGASQSNLVYARNIVIYFCKEKTKCSNKFIGAYFGGRHHASVMHSCNEVRDSMKEIKSYNDFIIKIDQSIVWEKSSKEKK